MIFWESLVLCSFLCGALALENELATAKQSAEEGILHLMSRSSKILARNPNQALGCFAYYSPIMSNIMTVYEENYNVCVGNANAARKAADATTVKQRGELEANAANACDAVNKCKSAVSADSAYQCYVDGASQSSKALNSLSSDASGKLVVFQKTLRSIDSDEKICITDNKLQYEKDWDKVYDEFNDCINGLIAVTTEAPSSLQESHSPASLP